MAFIIDKQTLGDLSVFESGRKKSIYELFCQTTTRGGAALLQTMFQTPLDDLDRICQRTRVIRFFGAHKAEFPLSNTVFDAVEYYLSNTDERSQLDLQDNTMGRKVRSAMGADGAFEQIHKGVLAVIELVNRTRDLLQAYPWSEIGADYEKNIGLLHALVSSDAFCCCEQERDSRKIGYESVSEYDKIFRFKQNDVLRRMLSILYEIDVYMCVARVAQQRGFAFAEPVATDDATILDVRGLYHPFLDHPVANDLCIDRSNNMIFLTGANMAGKSTFMKSVSVAMYLAHVGFPVAAQSMRFAVRSGMFTTINLPDNLNMGYSHFYAEVLRVKKVAQSVGEYPNLMIVFDELFRGTNVRDAYDATIAIVQAFARNRNALFIISTHIVEAAEILRDSCPNVNFIYLPTTMQGSVPQYTYRLATGVTADRHGMMIIRNERILELLEESPFRNGASK